MSDTKLREKADALIAFTLQGPRFIAWVEAVTDSIAPAPEKVAKVECVKCGKPQDPNALHCVAFATTDKAHRQQVEYRYTCQPAPPEPAKVECPNCGEMTERSHSRYEGPGPDKWACQPAPPEPAAPEMPEAVYIAANTLRASGHVTLADALLKEAWHSQPVAVGMTEELSMVLLRAEYGATEDERNPNLRDGYVARLKSAIETVRQQAAQVKL